MRGVPSTEEIRLLRNQRIGKAMKGKERSTEHCLKLSEAQKGKYYPNRYTPGRNQKISKTLTGRPRSKEHSLNISKAKSGKLNLKLRGTKRPDLSKWNREHPLQGEMSPHWQGGISFMPYDSKFNSQLKTKIHNRDNHTCQLCGITEREHIDRIGQRLTVHHVDYNKRHTSEENLILLCHSCNSKVNHQRDSWIEYFKRRITCPLFQ